MLGRKTRLLCYLVLCLPVVAPAKDLPTIKITENTNPEIAELYQQLQNADDKIKQIQSERKEKLTENYQAVKDNEQSKENRTLTGLTTAATGIGAMELAQGLTEQQADKDAEQDMAAYMATIRCTYGEGKQVQGGTQEIELPGGNDSEIMKLRAEYIELAADLKTRKDALGLRPGIESEEILDKAQMGLYDDENIGITDGAYASQYRAQMMGSEKDAEKLAADAKTSKNRVIGGATAAGIGVVGGIVGNAIINKDAPKEQSKQINAEYDKQLAEATADKDGLTEQLNQAIAENATNVKKHNDQLQQHQNLVAQINQSNDFCRDLFDEYVETISTIAPVENETDVVPNTTFPDISEPQNLLNQCTSCTNTGKTFDPNTHECSCPTDTPIEKGGKCVAIGDAIEFDDTLLEENEDILLEDLPEDARLYALGINDDEFKEIPFEDLPEDVRKHEEELTMDELLADMTFDDLTDDDYNYVNDDEDDDETEVIHNDEDDQDDEDNNEEEDTGEEYCPGLDDKGKNPNRLNSITDKTKIGDFCSSSRIAGGEVIWYDKAKTKCTCLAYACKSDKYEVINGACKDRIKDGQGNCLRKEYSNVGSLSAQGAALKFCENKALEMCEKQYGKKRCSGENSKKCKVTNALKNFPSPGKVVCNATQEELDGVKSDTAKRKDAKIKYYNCCDTNQVPKDIVCKCINKFSANKVTPMEANKLMTEYAAKNHKDDIKCDEKSHRTQSDGNRFRQCGSRKNSKWHYEFSFRSLDNGNSGFYNAFCSLWDLKAGQHSCKDASETQCKEISDVVNRTFFPGGSAKLTNSGVYLGSRAISKSTECTINEHPVAGSGAVALVNKTITKEDLRTIGTINPLYFYDKGQQVNANSDVYKAIENYLFVEQKLPIKPFRCGASFVDNTNYFNGSRTQFNEQNEKQRKCIEDSQKFSGGGEHAAQSYGGVVSGCRRQYPVDTKTGDLLTCEYNGQQIDFLFRKLDAIWDRKSTGGYQALRCLSEGGSFTGKSCTVADRAKCDEFNARFKKDYPNSKGMEWDDSLKTCVLKDAKMVKNVQKVAEVTGMVTLTLVTAIAGGPVVWGLSVVEGAALVTEAITEEKISDWAEQFLVEANRCNNSSCANTVMKKHIARIMAGTNQFSETQNSKIAQQTQRLLEMLDENTLAAILDKGNAEGFIGEDRDPDLEKSIKAYYGTQLTGKEKALLVAKKASTVLTFSTLLGAGVMAGLRQAVKHNWLKLSEARKAKWLKWKILTPGDVAALTPNATVDAVEMTPAQAKKLDELNTKITALESKTNRTHQEAEELKKLHQERNELMNKLGTKDADELARAQSAAFDQKAIDDARLEYDKAMERRNYVADYMAKHNGNPPKNVTKQSINEINDNVAKAEKKLKELGQDVTPAEPLKIGQKPTVTTTEPKPTTTTDNVTNVSKADLTYSGKLKGFKVSSVTPVKENVSVSVFKFVDEVSGKTYYLKHTDEMLEITRTKQAYAILNGKSDIVHTVEVIEDDQKVLMDFATKHNLTNSSGNYWFVMNEMPGSLTGPNLINDAEQSLRNVLRGKPLTLAEQEEILNSIQRLHDNGIVHGDLYSNMFFTREANGKLRVDIIDYEPWSAKMSSASEEMDDIRALMTNLQKNKLAQTVDNVPPTGATPKRANSVKNTSTTSRGVGKVDNTVATQSNKYKIKRTIKPFSNYSGGQKEANGVFEIVDNQTGQVMYLKRTSANEVDMTKRAANVNLGNNSIVHTVEPADLTPSQIDEMAKSLGINVPDYVQADTWLLTKAVPEGEDLMTVVEHGGKLSTGARINNAEIDQIIAEMKKLRAAGVNHTDLYTNTIIRRTADGKLEAYIIDFESAGIHDVDFIEKELGKIRTTTSTAKRTSAKATPEKASATGSRANNAGKATSQSTLSTLGQKASKNFDSHLSKVKTSELDNPYTATFDARNMTETEWNQLNKSLNKEGVEIVDIVREDGIAGKRLQRIGAKFETKTAQAEASTITLLRKKASENFDTYLAEAKNSANGESAHILSKERLSKEEWAALNQSLEHENVQLVEVTKNGKPYVQFLRNDRVGFDVSELARKKGNEGKLFHKDYIFTSKDARKYMNGVIASGKYTRGTDDYVEAMNQMHRISAEGPDGTSWWYSKTKAEVNPGVIRTYGVSNGRVKEAMEMEQLAKKYGDPYRFNVDSKVKLPGIPEYNLPWNTHNAPGLEGEFRHVYPSGTNNGLRPYYEQMYRTSKEALALIEKGASERTILEKIAEHYQYAANARPYANINNSMFMNEVNTLLQKAGMRTMPHGDLDFAAMHLQPNTFKKYFVDTYYATRL